MASSKHSTTFHPDDVPLPIVAFGRWTYVITLSTAFLLQQPLITTVLFFVVLIAVLFGARWNLVGIIGQKLLAAQLRDAQTRGEEREDYRLLRFNNAIAVTLLFAAQSAFALGAPTLAWIFVGMIIAASAAALAGYCLGCVLYYRFKVYRYKFLGEHS
jgi:Domain of unknown function (DUF4395)